jgi:prepilin-type N-terminal cleavage/methylation domain-containing protein
MDGKQKGFTLIEILVVVTIIGVLAGLVVVLIPKGQFEANKTECISNVKDLVGLLEKTGQQYPPYSGPNLLLYFVIKGEIAKDEDKLRKLFCPGHLTAWDQSGGIEAYKSLDLTKQGEYDQLSSYAGRDQKSKECGIRRGEQATYVLVCDEDEAYHNKKGLVVGLSGGSVKWRDKVDNYKIDIETAIAVGDGSNIDELKCLRRE